MGRACQASTDEIIINVLCTGENVVWACGFNGAILKGNASTGFKDVSHYDDNMIFSKMVIFEGRVYLASNEGLYSFSLEKEKLSSRRSKELMIVKICRL